MPETLTIRDLNRATLARQMLLSRERIPTLEAVERLVALQAQWPRPPFLGLWSRVEAFRREDLRRLLLDRRVVRATFNRATIHLVTAADFLAFRSTIGTGLEAALAAVLGDRLARVDIPGVLASARALFAGRPRTFEDVRAAFVAADSTVDERAIGYAVRLLLPLVQVPVEGETWGYPAKASFALADEWLGRDVTATAPAPERLVRRYLAAYGPASKADLQAWSGIRALGEVLESLRPSLVTVRDERKRELFDVPDAPRPGGDAEAPVRFVADYDNLIVGRADERFVAKAHRPRVFLPGLRIAPTVLVDGFVAATWAVERKKTEAAIIVSPFAAIPPRVKKAITAEGEALARFVEPDARAWHVRFDAAS